MNILNTINLPTDLHDLTVAELETLAQEIRQLIINTVSKNGGHLASNLGMVETTLAIHKVFNTPNDKIIFDVGHQCYTHKIITGRREAFSTLRQENGISGFPKRSESDYDVFNTGHSSTSISAAIGMARARDMQDEDRNIIAIIGDGALTGGMAWEALNDVGQSQEKMIIILNDNEMSISKNVGAIPKYLSNLRSRHGYINIKGVLSKVLLKIPLIGKPLKLGIEKVKNTIKYVFLPNVVFEEMGFKYYGIINGHSIHDMTTILTHCKSIDQPTIIHIRTLKGHGCDYAQKYPDIYHSAIAFDPVTGELDKKCKYEIPKALTKHLNNMAKNDSRICVVTAAMENGCGLDDFSIAHPNRFFDVGIAEQHAVTMAAGLSAGGMKPYFCVYSSFLQRAYDQILHDVCLQKLPVVFIVYNSGIVGQDGETHHGIFDISFLRHMPNLNLLIPASVKEAQTMLNQTYDIDCPSAILIGTSLPQRNIYNEKQTDMFSWHMCTKAQNKKLAILTSSTMLIKAMDAIRNDSLYLRVDVFNARCIKPMDIKSLAYIINNYEYIVTIEDNIIQGGFGSAVLEQLTSFDFNVKNIFCLGYKNSVIAHGSKEYILSQNSLDAKSIAQSILNIIGEK